MTVAGTKWNWINTRTGVCWLKLLKCQAVASQNSWRHHLYRIQMNNIFWRHVTQHIWIQCVKNFSLEFDLSSSPMSFQLLFSLYLFDSQADPLHVLSSFGFNSVTLGTPVEREYIILHHFKKFTSWCSIFLPYVLVSENNLQWSWEWSQICITWVVPNLN